MNKLLTATVLCCIAGICMSAEVSSYQDFENHEKNWTSTVSSASITSERFKSGKKSLLWQWNNSGAELTLSGKAVSIMKNRKGTTCFGMWLYNEKPVDRRLNVEFMNGARVLKKVWYNLNFRGWRPLGADYVSSGLKPGTKITGIRLSAPAGSGKLYIDCFTQGMLCRRGPIADYQQPWAENPKDLKSPSKYLYSSKNWNLNRPWLPKYIPADKLTAGQRKSIETVKKRVLPHLQWTNMRKYGSFEQLKKEFESYGISRKNGIITGKPIQCGRNAFLPVKGAIDFNKKYIWTSIKLYSAWKKEKSPANKVEAAKMFNLLSEHFMDQGWQEGNNNMGWLGNGYDIRYWPCSIIKMAQVLDQAGIRDDMLKSAAWFMMGNEVVKPKPHSSTDQFYNYSSNYPALTVMLKNEGQIFMRLMGFKLYLDRMITADLPFGPDGTIHHHGGHHLGYGGYSPPILIATQIAPLHNTIFAIAHETMERLRKYTRTYEFQNVGGKCLPNMYLRSGTLAGVDPAGCALGLAEMGAADGKTPDPEMAGIYLNCVKKNTPAAEGFRRKGIKPLQQTGHMNLNFSATGLHRRKDWLVAAVGMVKGFRGLEIYGWMEANNYGRYARNGSVWPARPGRHGFTLNGWNQNFWPGATSVVRPACELFEGYTMFHNQSPLAGGTNMDGNGVWGMDFIGNDVHFKKSAFMFDDRVTVITTNINKANPKPKGSSGADAVTTLFQQELEKKSMPITVNGKKITTLPFAETLPAGKAAKLVDVIGNAYYIWPGSSPVKMLRRHQQWTYMFKRYLKNKKNNPCKNIRRKQYREKPLQANEKYYNPTESDFALAYFDHGKAPKNAECVYTLLPFAGKTGLAEFISAKPVDILQKNGNAHIVYDKPSKTYGYVVFNAEASLKGPLASVSRPCFVMVKPENGKYKISVAITDRSNPGIVTLRIKGISKPVTIKLKSPLIGTIEINK
jgi:chondroitin-sulfate-ABC endolyase/exolyase